MKKKNHVKLPIHVRPERYEIMLKPDLENFLFEGEETIFLTLDKSVNEITLHSKELEIESAVFRVKSKGIRVKNIKYDEKAETIIFSFADKLPKGAGELKLKFKGILNDKMRGFYRSKYHHKGKERHMATTQFEATDARRAFPCFDEPAQKAIFDVTLMIPSFTTAISNTIETEVVEHTNGLKSVKFASTPKMSTYLLAFIVGEFEWIESKTKDGVVVRVFTTPGKKHQAKFALGCAVKSLEFYNNYFGIPYPLPVMDLIAIPDFESAAMENWGAVTYRESALLVDEERSSTANKEWVAIVVAHELAHQWFGNLVTMDWWTDLWLNEGFASYMEYLAVDHMFPKWNMWTQYVGGRFARALDLDSLEHTHPIEIEVHHPDEIGEIFDEVSYAKGSAVIRMLAEYLGAETFRRGLGHYLKKHQFGNAITSDLWKSFEEVSGKPVGKIMQNWTSRAGYPLVSVADGGKILNLSQKRFYSSPLSLKTSKDNTVWQIPVSLSSDKDMNQDKIILASKSQAIKLPENLKWIKFNAGQTGFFRTKYPENLLEGLSQPIKAKKLPAADRLGILSDAFALVEAGQMPTVALLELLKSYEDENDYTVWTEIISCLRTLDSLLFETDARKKFNEFSRKMLKKIAERVGWVAKKHEDHTTTLLRSLVLVNLGHFGDKDIKTKSLKMFWGKKNIPADLRGIVYRMVAENGSNKEFLEMKKRYEAEPMHEEQDRLGRNMAFFADEKILAKVFDFAMSGKVRIQDTPFIIGSGFFNPAGRNAVLSYVKKNWKNLADKFGSGHLIVRFIHPMDSFVSKEKADEIEQFFKKYPTPSANRTIKQVLEKIISNDAWLKRDLDSINEWLKK